MSTPLVGDWEHYLAVFRRTEDERGPKADISADVQISEDEHLAITRSAHNLMRAQRRPLVSLVRANARAVSDHMALLLQQLHDGTDRPDHDTSRLELQLGLSNWLSSVRWFLDHTYAHLTGCGNSRSLVLALDRGVR